MSNLRITLVDGSTYAKRFATRELKQSFLAKLDLFEGLLIDFFSEGKKVRINPKYILKIEEEVESLSDVNPEALGGAI